MTQTTLLAVVALAATAGAALAQGPTVKPPAQDPRLPVYVSSHVDVTPDYVDQTRAALQAYVAGARKEPGAVRVEAVQEARPNHFDLIEVWRDRAAYEAHTATAATIRFHDAIHPWRGSPFEERLGILIGP